MRDLLLYFLRAIAEKPEAIQIEESEQGGTLTLLVKVADEDKGRVIGKQGRVIKALRTVLAAASTPNGHKVAVDVE